MATKRPPLATKRPPLKRYPLTPTFVDKARLPQGKDSVNYPSSDVSARGLVLRVHGTPPIKTWVVRFRVGRGGRQGWMALGRYPTLGVLEAHQRAREVLAMAARGLDPRTPPQAPPTVAELVDKFVKDELPKLRGPARKYYLREIREALGHVVAEELTRAQVIALFDEVTKRSPSSANGVVWTLRRLLSWAADRELCSLPKGNPAARIKLNPAPPRDRCLSELEIPLLIQAIAAEEDPYRRALLRLLVATGRRFGEIANLRWGDLDLLECTAHLERTKTDTRDTIYLPKIAMQIIGELASLRVVGDDRLFPPSKGKAIAVGDAWARVQGRLQAGVESAGGRWESLHMHDLRTCWRTWARRIGIQVDVAEAAIGHARPKIRATYDIVSPEEERAALEKVSAWFWSRSSTQGDAASPSGCGAAPSPTSGDEGEPGQDQGDPPAPHPLGQKN